MKQLFRALIILGVFLTVGPRLANADSCGSISTAGGVLGSIERAAVTAGIATNTGYMMLNQRAHSILDAWPNPAYLNARIAKEGESVRNLYLADMAAMRVLLDNLARQVKIDIEPVLAAMQEVPTNVEPDLGTKLLAQALLWVPTSPTSLEGSFQVRLENALLDPDAWNPADKGAFHATMQTYQIVLGYLGMKLLVYSLGFLTAAIALVLLGRYWARGALREARHPLDGNPLSTPA